MRVLFIDDRMDEITKQWERSGCSQEFQILPLEPFQSIERTCELVQTYKPDAVIIGYGLGSSKPTGADVISSLRDQGYSGYIIANSGGGSLLFEEAGITIDANADRNPQGLIRSLETLHEGEDSGIL